MSDFTLDRTQAIRARHRAASAADYFALLKPRVMLLVVFVGLAGMWIAPGALPLSEALVTVFCIALGAGASGALNMWYERDLDAMMTRTAKRPLPAGRMAPEDALFFGLIMSVLPVLVLGLAVNWVAAGLLAAASAFYVLVYTVWLKRRTPQNIVIGGAAGAFPPMIGWAAVTGDVTIVPIILFALIFFWTPPHFWALALYKCKDYGRAGVPMLPVVAGEKVTRNQIWWYSLTLPPLALAPWYFGAVGEFYAVAAGVLSVVFLAAAWAVYRERDSYAAARRLFAFSILWLFLIFTFMMLDPATGAAGPAMIGLG
ncbi:MAG: heme o synthase [Alphaproteobacteria bacterium]